MQETLNFGGLSCSLLEPATLVAYADAMARCVLLALRRWRGRVVIAVGGHVLGQMDDRALSAIRPVELVDLSHDSYLAELRRSRLLVSSAGMHALYEAFASGVPCLCLPAQNLSQSLALGVLERRGLPAALDWTQLYGLECFDPTDEAGACARIAEQIHRFHGDPAAQARLVRHIGGLLSHRRLATLEREQALFFAAQGEPGAPRIADRLRDLLDGRSPQTWRKGA